MFEFKNRDLWKVMLYIVYCGMCLIGFRCGVAIGVSIFILAATTPIFIISVVKFFISKDMNLLYNIPVWILAISISVCVYTFSDKIDNKIMPTDDSVGTQEISYKSDYFDEVVYITRSGNKYHKKDCEQIKDSEIIGITLREAFESYKTPCSKCNN